MKLETKMKLASTVSFIIGVLVVTLIAGGFIFGLAWLIGWKGVAWTWLGVTVLVYSFDWRVGIEKDST